VNRGEVVEECFERMDQRAHAVSLLGARYGRSGGPEPSRDALSGCRNGYR
jgi:hypothetical protein